MLVFSRFSVVFVVLLATGCPDMPLPERVKDTGISDDSGVDADVKYRNDAGTEEDSDAITTDAGVTIDADAGTAITNDADADSDIDGDVDSGIGGDADADAEVAMPDGWELILAGTFMMGSPDGELGRTASQERQHEVTLTNNFIIQVTEVTQSQFVALMGYNNSRFSDCDDCPVESVDWHEAAAYCNALSVSEDLSLCYECDGLGEDVECTPSHYNPYRCPGYRLPTEAEWEYAARAGTTTATYNGDLDTGYCHPLTEVLNPIAWYAGNSEVTTQVVGRLAANAWGLHDMLGNVQEWCHDRFVDNLGSDAVIDPFGPDDGAHRSARGGNARSCAGGVRAASRESGWSGSPEPPPFDIHLFGIRPVRSIPTGAILVSD